MINNLLEKLVKGLEKYPTTEDIYGKHESVLY